MKFLLTFIGANTTVKVVVASIAIAILDTVGITIIFPYLQLYLEPEKAISGGVLGHAYSQLKFTSSQHFVLFVSLALLAFFITKFILGYWLTDARNRINANITRRLSDELFRLLMGARYGFLTRNSVSEMAGIINAQTIHGTICFESVVNIGTEVLFLSLILISLALISPATAIGAIVLVTAFSLGLYFAVIRRMTVIGKRQADVHLHQYKYVYGVINGIKDIKIMGLEAGSLREHVNLNAQFFSVITKFNLYQTFSKSIIETAILVGALASATAILSIDVDIAAIAPMLGFLAVGAIRVIPSYGKIVGGYNSYKYYHESLALLSELHAKLVANQVSVVHLDLPFRRSIRLEGVSVEYEGRPILDRVSMTVEKGMSVGIVGSSGAGKTTFLDVLVGLREADNGEFFMDDVRFDPYRTDALKSLVGYVPQNVALVDESIAFNIAFGAEYDEQRLEQAARVARIHEFVVSLPQGYGTLIGENGVRLSGGQRQRIGVARALYRDPSILIFDEATSALDTITEEELSAEIQALSGSKTVIIVAHRMTTIARCDVIHVFDKGRIIATGTHRDLMASCETYRTMSKGAMDFREGVREVG